MLDLEKELLKRTFTSIKEILDDYGFPNLYTLHKKDMENWYRDTITNINFEDVLDSDSGHGVLIRIKDGYVRVEYGASKVVFMTSKIDNWVFKVPYKDYESNYCQMEVEIYENAEREGVEEFFAPCYFLENFDGAAIYVMARAEVSFDRLYSDLYERFSSEGRAENEIEDMLIDIEDSDEYVDWLFPYYSDYDSFEKFVEFLRNSNINDLHSGNIGYIGDNVVLIDYSGYFG